MLEWIIHALGLVEPVARYDVWSMGMDGQPRTVGLGHATAIDAWRHAHAYSVKHYPVPFTVLERL